MKLLKYIIAAVCIVSGTATAQSNSTVYGYSLGAAPHAAIDRESTYVRVTESKDLFRLNSSTAQTVEVLFEETSVLNQFVIKHENLFRECRRTESEAVCRSRAAQMIPGLNHIAGLISVSVKLAPQDALVIYSRDDADGGGIVDIFVEGKSGSTKIRTIHLVDRFGTNLILPNVLLGDRSASQLGGFTGQPTVLRSRSDQLSSIIKEGVDGSIPFSPALAGLLEVMSPQLAHAQQGGGGVRVYTMNGFSQGRNTGPHTFSGDLKAFGNAAQEQGMDVEVFQVLYTDSWRGPGVCETARLAAEEIMKDIATNPMQPGEKLIVAGHSFGGLIALIMKANPNCLPPGFPDFLPYAYDPPLTGVYITFWVQFMLSQLGEDMLPNSEILALAASVQLPEGYTRSRKNPDGTLKPFGELGEGSMPDHDPYETTKRDRPANQKERSAVRRDFFKLFTEM